MRKQMLPLLAGLLLASAAQAQILKKPTELKEPPSPTKTYPELLVEELPRFTGGDPAIKDPNVALQEFLAKNVIIPEFAKRNLLAAAVDVGFVITADGRMDSLTVTNGACCGFDEEALRVARLTEGKWQPGKIQGQPVRVRYDMPVVFRVQNKNASSPKKIQEMAALYSNYRNSAEYTRDREAYEQKVREQK